ncbi:hypothetical protein TNCV_1930341 [Trichonephila clavipes]|nr:hypothetical protein TNCV_1930341 [Trichonephila clavipes]
MNDTIRTGIEAYKCCMYLDISFHICFNLASSSFKLTGCPTHRPKWSKICSIGDKSEDRAGQERIVTVRIQSCDGHPCHVRSSIVFLKNVSLEPLHEWQLMWLQDIMDILLGWHGAKDQY